MEIPLAADHFGHIGVNSCIRLGKALEKYNLAWLEDMIPWQYTELWKKITDAIDVPTLTGEDIYLKEPLRGAGRNHAVDMIQPGPAHVGRHSRNQEDRRHGAGIRRADGHAHGRNADCLHGRTSTAPRPRRTSWCWRTTRWTCPGGATW